MLTVEKNMGIYTVDPIYISRNKNRTRSQKIHGKLIENQLAKVVRCAGFAEDVQGGSIRCVGQDSPMSRDLNQGTSRPVRTYSTYCTQLAAVEPRLSANLTAVYSHWHLFYYTSPYYHCWQYSCVSYRYFIRKVHVPRVLPRGVTSRSYLEELPLPPSCIHRLNFS